MRWQDCVANRLAHAWCADSGWQWGAFDDLLSIETGMIVTTIRSENFTSGEVSGAAIRSDRGAVVMVPESVTLDHAIHIAAHEAWHLIANHSGCSAGPDEAEAEAFAHRFGTRVRVLQRGTPGQWVVALGVH